MVTMIKIGMMMNVMTMLMVVMMEHDYDDDDEGGGGGEHRDHRCSNIYNSYMANVCPLTGGGAELMARRHIVCCGGGGKGREAAGSKGLSGARSQLARLEIAV